MSHMLKSEGLETLILRVSVPRHIREVYNGKVRGRVLQKSFQSPVRGYHRASKQDVILH